MFRNYYRVIALFFVVKAAFLLFLFLGGPLIPVSAEDYWWNAYHFEQKGFALPDNLAAWDGQYYLKNAVEGYVAMPERDQDRRAYAMFPLYPFLIRCLSAVLPISPLAAGLMISSLSSLFGVVFLYKLVMIDHSGETAERSVLFHLICPAAVFFMAVYTEATFFFLSVAAFYYALRRSWWVCGVFGFLAALTRPQGVLLFVPMVVEYTRYLRELKGERAGSILSSTRGNFLSLLLIPAGLMSYLAFSAVKTGNILFPVDIQTAFARKPADLLNIFRVLADEIGNFRQLPAHGYLHSKLDLLFTLFFAILPAFMLRRLRPSYLIYAISLVVVPLSTGATIAMTRYLSVSFPHFLMLGLLGEKKLAGVAVTVIFVLLMSALGLRFINWYWAG
jgi:Gpi18-like mannosyltransferase